MIAWFKYLWVGLSVCLAMLLLAALGLVVYQDEIEEKLIAKVQEISGRELQIRAGFGFKFSPSLAVYAKDVVLENAAWSANPWMLKIKQVEVKLSFISLLRGKLNIAAIKIDAPYFLFERGPAGEFNWHFALPKYQSPQPLAQLYKYLLLDKAVLNNAQFDVQTNPKRRFIKLNQITAKVDSADQSIALKAIGSAENRVIQVQGKVSDFRSMLLRQPSVLQLSGNYAAMIITAEGTVADLLRWQGLDITATATVPSLAFFQGWSGANKLPDTPKIVASGRFLQPQRWSSAHLEAIEIMMESAGGSTRLSGSFANLQRGEGLTLQGDSQYQVRPWLDKMAWGGSEDATFSANYRLSGAIDQGLSLDLEQALLIGEGLSASAQGFIDNLSASDSSAITLRGQVDSLHYLGKLLGTPADGQPSDGQSSDGQSSDGQSSSGGEAANKPWPMTAPLKINAQLLRKNGAFALSEINGEAYGGKVKVVGEVVAIGALATAKLQLQGRLNAADIAALNQANAASLPKVDSIAARADFVYADARLTAENASIEFKLGDATLNASGAIADVATLRLENAAVKADNLTAAAVNAAYDIEWPELGYMRANANLSGSIKEKYALNGIIGSIISADHWLELKGDIGNLGAEMQADLAIKAEAKTFAGLQADLATWDLPAEIGATAEFKLNSQRANRWSIDALQVDLLPPIQGQISGGVYDFPLQTRYDLQLDIEAISTADIAPLRDLRAFDGSKVAIKAALQTAAGETVVSLRNIEALISQTNTVNSLAIIGHIGDVAALSGINLKGHLSGADATSLSEFSGLELKANLPFAVEFAVQRAHKAADFAFKIKQARLADSDLAGVLRLRLPKLENELAYISGNLSSQNLNLVNLRTKNARQELFSAAPFSLDWASNFNAEVALNIADLNGLIANIKNVKGKFKLDQGYISMPGLVGKIGDGELIWWLVIDSNATPYSIISSVQGVDLDAQKLNLFGDSKLIKDGLIDVDMGISGQGVSLAQMMGSAYGKLQLQLKSAALKNQNLELFGADLILGFLNIINPLSKQQAYIDIECGVIHFPIKDGKAYADQGIAIKTDRVTVLGGGEIDLKNENLRVLIKPKARKGLGISTGIIAQIIQINGTIDKPEIAVATSSFFATAAMVSAATVSGGWTLLAQGLFDRNKANSDVCQQTLKSPVFATAAINKNGKANENGDQSNK